MLVYPTVWLATPPMSPHWKQGVPSCGLQDFFPNSALLQVLEKSPFSLVEVLQGTVVAYFESCFGNDSDSESYCGSCSCFWSKFGSKFVIYPCLSDLISQYHFEVPPAVSNAFWWATLRASSYGSHLFNLGHCSSSCSMLLVVVVEYPHLCI